MDDALSAARWQFSFVYLDDIVVFSRSASEHINHVRHVLILLSDYGFSQKLKKCSLFTKTINYLDQIICQGQLNISSHIADAIKEIKSPRNDTELKSLLGICNVFKQFVPNLARIA